MHRRECKECYEGKPQHQENNLKDALSLIEEAVPGKGKYSRDKEGALISSHSIGVNRRADS
jgi:hypothetical protein